MLGGGVAADGHVGPRWLSALDKDGRPRLEQEGDLV